MKKSGGKKKINRIRVKKLVMFLILNLAVAAAGSAATTNKIATWYVNLTKPDFAPPNWLFGPVWTVLYAMMATAAYKASEKGSRMIWYWGQLGLNFAWSWVFFGGENPGLGLVVIGGLWLGIALCIRDFERRSKPAAWLMVPYLLWVSFAAVLNYAIWRLN